MKVLYINKWRICIMFISLNIFYFGCHFQLYDLINIRRCCS